MTYLKASENDWDVAHRETHLDDVYRELLAKTKAEAPEEFPWTFSSVPGFFKQATDANIDDACFDYTQDFGRLKPWQQIIDEINHLNQQEDNVRYKLVFFARHGQGPHNIIVDTYGLEAWLTKYRYMGEDPETGLVYAPDPPLSQLGELQAAENNQAWRRQLAAGAPVPTKFYVSPLQRSCQTLEITWKGIDIPHKPVVCELLRETIGINLCDKRLHRHIIEERFPHYCTSRLHHDDDLLFGDDIRELFAEQSLRCNRFLQKLFDDPDTVVSTTSHGGTIRGFITVLNHPKFCISTGGMIPMVIKGERTI